MADLGRLTADASGWVDEASIFFKRMSPVAKGFPLEPVEEEDVMVDKERVNHPPHYTQGDVECIEAIKSALTPEEYRGYCKGNAMKYIWRERMKGSNESLAKAEWYLKEVQK